ncbi:MAG: hypothetical protein ACFFDH_05450 [Promethearchaeota archaeon]
MRNKSKNLNQLLLILITLFVILSPLSKPLSHLKTQNFLDQKISPLTASSGSYNENFTDTVYMDVCTNTSGWGDGTIHLPNVEMTLSNQSFSGLKIITMGDIAYIDVMDDIEIYDISNRSSPILLGSTGQWCADFFVSGNYMYLAAGDLGILIFNITDPSNPTLVGSNNSYDPWYPFLDVDARFIVVSGDYAYIIDREVGVQFIVFDVSDPTNPVGYSYYGEVPYDLGYIDDMLIKGDYIYIITHMDTVITADVSDPSNPIIYYLENIYSLAMPDSRIGYISGNELFVGGLLGLEIINITNPENMTQLSYIEFDDYVVDCIFVEGNYLYLGIFGIVASNWNVLVYNISDLSNPNLEFIYNLPSNESPRSLDIKNGIAIILTNHMYVTVDFNKINVFKSNAVAISLELFVGSSTFLLSSLILTVSGSTPIGTSLIYYLTPDNGTHWEQVVPGMVHWFTYFGNVLKWKVIFSSSDPNKTPLLYTLNISYSTVLIAPSLNIPEDNDHVNIPYPYFEWYSLSGAIEYFFQLDTSTNFDSIDLRNITTSNNHYSPITPLSDGMWYWRVAAIDSEGDIGIFSNHRTLIIDTPPGIPILEVPNNQSYINSLRPTFSWNSVPDAVNYTLQLDTSTLFSSADLINFFDINSINYEITSNLSDGEWYWRVCAFDTSGNRGNYSSYFSFTIDTIIPTVDNPEDILYKEGSIGNNITWNVFDINPDYYIITRNGVNVQSDVWEGNSININVDGLSIGTYIFNCTVYDKAGNFNIDIIEVKVESDAGTQAVPSDLIISSIVGGLTVFGIGIVLVRKRRIITKY